MIQFTKNEFLASNDSSEVEVVIERIHSIKDEVKVMWQSNIGSNGSFQNGSVKFDNTSDVEFIRLKVQNITHNESIKIELYAPTNGYQLGEKSISRILFACPYTKFMCQIGVDFQCIKNSFKCDGIRDCNYGSDEINCVTECPNNEFMCENKEVCIPSKWTCDGLKDCWDGSDETNCTSSTCNGFWCSSNNQCMKCKFKCDGKEDCHDGSDENDCFECENGNVTRKDFICNSVDDCSDGSDEKDCKDMGNQQKQHL